MKVDFEILLHDCCAKQKQHKISSLGLGSWDPAAKEHRRLYNVIRRETNSLGGGMRILDPHELYTILIEFQSAFSDIK